MLTPLSIPAHPMTYSNTPAQGNSSPVSSNPLIPEAGSPIRPTAAVLSNVVGKRP